MELPEAGKERLVFHVDSGLVSNPTIRRNQSKNTFAGRDPSAKKVMQYFVTHNQWPCQILIRPTLRPLHCFADINGGLDSIQIEWGASSCVKTTLWQVSIKTKAQKPGPPTFNRRKVKSDHGHTVRILSQTCLHTLSQDGVARENHLRKQSLRHLPQPQLLDRGCLPSRHQLHFPACLESEKNCIVRSSCSIASAIRWRQSFPAQAQILSVRYPNVPVNYLWAKQVTRNQENGVSAFWSNNTIPKLKRDLSDLSVCRNIQRELPAVIAFYQVAQLARYDWHHREWENQHNPGAIPVALKWNPLWTSGYPPASTDSPRSFRTAMSSVIGLSPSNTGSRKNDWLLRNSAWAKGSSRTFFVRPASFSESSGSTSNMAEVGYRYRSVRVSASTVSMIGRMRSGARWTSSITVRSWSRTI